MTKMKVSVLKRRFRSSLVSSPKGFLVGHRSTKQKNQLVVKRTRNEIGKGAQWKLSDKSEIIRVKKARAVLEILAVQFQLSQEK